MPLLQETFLDVRQRLRKDFVPLAAFGDSRKDGMLVVIKLLFEIGGLLGRLITGDILLPVGQPLTKEVVRFVLLLDNSIESIQVMVSVPLRGGND